MNDKTKEQRAEAQLRISKNRKKAFSKLSLSAEKAAKGFDKLGAIWREKPQLHNQP